MGTKLTPSEKQLRINNLVIFTLLLLVATVSFGVQKLAAEQPPKTSSSCPAVATFTPYPLSAPAGQTTFVEMAITYSGQPPTGHGAFTMTITLSKFDSTRGLYLPVSAPMALQPPPPRTVGFTIGPGQYQFAYSFNEPYSDVTGAGSGGAFCADTYNFTVATGPATAPAGTKPPLLVRGSLIGQTVGLYRANGDAHSSAASASESYNGSNLAESIIYTPAVWLNSPFTTPASQKLQYDSIVSLPPVL